MSDGCQNHDRGQDPPRRPKSEPPVRVQPAGSAASPGNRAILETIAKNAPDEEREWTPMEDARLMIDLWDTCITKKITIERGSPIHRLVKMTLQRLRQNDKLTDSRPR